MEADSRYSFLVTEFGQEKLEERYKMVCEILLNFISAEKLDGIVAISEVLVSQAVTDYFVDIYRIKDFHDIKRVNEIKIYSYLSYWLWRRKPLQVIGEDESGSLQFVNESMIASLLESFLFQSPSDIPIVTDKREEFDAFIQVLQYYLRYRAVNPQSIELMIHAFLGGRAYQYSADYRA
jgi:hypothetical protein